MQTVRLRSIRPLHQGWEVRPFAGAALDRVGVIPGEVPGCIHTDLLRAGLIDDPEVDRHDLAIHWVAESDWTWTTTFEASVTDSDVSVDLVFEGLDTFATVVLNGTPVGVADNMHVTWRFDVRAALVDGTNALEVRFESPLRLARARESRFGVLPHEGHGANPPLPYNAVRKMACSFGWDWGPPVPSMGIWRAVSLEVWQDARFGSVRPLVTLALEDRGRIEVHAEVVRMGHERVHVDARLVDEDGTEVVRAASEGDPIVLDVDRPRRWFPVGQGDPHLYTLHLDLRNDDGELLDRIERRVGIRSVELVTDADAEGNDFHVRLNGRRVYCRGANWIPDDLFPHRIDRARYRSRVEQAVGANMNMLRVWGGGLYEDHAFFEACDALGVMVWQDFLFSCAAYPEDKAYASSVELEARDNVARLSAHPSLVLWCGNNECHEAHRHWGPFESLRARPEIRWGRKYYHDVLPRVLAELDPTRPYWPSSPFTEDESKSPRDESSGDQHIWDVWNGEGNAMRYLMHRPRFASEFGFHGPPTWPTLCRAIPEDQRRFDSPAMIHHNKHAGGQALANVRMADAFDPPEDFDDWLYLAQVMQARALDLGCRWFRALSPYCSGALYWQFNDIWPGASWSAIDGDGRPKPLWFATRRFFRPRVVSIVPRRPAAQAEDPGPLEASLHNDANDPWETTVEVHGYDVNGGGAKVIASRSIRVEPGGSARVEIEQAAPVLVATVDGDRAFWFAGIDRELRYPAPAFDLHVERRGTNHTVHLRARSLLRDLCLFPERLHPEATISDQLLTLLPGDEVTLTIESPAPLSKEDLSTPPVLQCANRFGA